MIPTLHANVLEHKFICSGMIEEKIDTLSTLLGSAVGRSIGAEIKSLLIDHRSPETEVHQAPVANLNF